MMKYSELNAWQKKRMLVTLLLYVLVTLTVLTCFAAAIYQERSHSRESWGTYLSDTPEQAQMVQQRAVNATNVNCGTYIDNIRELNLKSSYFRVEMQVWFSWDGDEGLDMANNFRIYKGIVNSKKIMKEIHENGKNYQLVSVDATISKSFDTKRFPLESHQMRIYVESVYPIEKVRLIADSTNSGLNRSLAISGFKFLNQDIGEVSYLYDSTHGDPEISGSVMTSEIVTAIEINRLGYGLYFKCFIALFGTIIWTYIALFLNARHHVDPLGMLPGALFGAVGNIMVGAGLLPDALETGLLEYVNIWGIITILSIALIIINVNRLRAKYNDSPFAHYYGVVMFYVSLAITLLGNILLPVLAYIN